MFFKGGNLLITWSWIGLLFQSYEMILHMSLTGRVGVLLLIINIYPWSNQNEVFNQGQSCV